MKSRRTMDPRQALGRDFLGIEKPCRYLGGEAGALRAVAPEPSELFVALSFPDLYEIGMSNNAIRILYAGLNAREGIRCERVFAPAPDYEALLAKHGLPLGTLESGVPLRDADLLGFSVGYELAATSILTILDRGGIPLRAAERGEGDPIVIAGGPAVSNPHSLSAFLDAVWIGEAEESFFDLCSELARGRKAGGDRQALLSILRASPHVWMPGKRAIRAIYEGFAESPYRMTFPVPVMKTAQSHGTVEIMRGCPHGCRFCHAGIWYRPQRIKPAPHIQEEVRELVLRGGYREITLSSLSSGDYPGIQELLHALNDEWKESGVSFQLPSLKVNTFTLPLIEALSEVRKSGLTFAVESPEDYRQLVINKDVSWEKLVAILKEARDHGFKTAKFYFMIGLPVPGRGVGEAEAIVSFFRELGRIVPLSFNVNVGVFVPKPHTSFQWCGQLPEEEAMEAVSVLREGLRPLRSVKLSWHSPFVALLESILSRGDERVGELVLEAWKRGARLDAWDEHFDRELWRSVLEGAAWNPLGEAARQRGLDEALPWDDVNPRVSKAMLLREWKRSQEGAFTPACAQECTEPCGACSGSPGIDKVDLPPPIPAPSVGGHRSMKSGHLLLRYRKSGKAVTYPHLGIVESLTRALLTAGLPLSYSEGFNPAPRIETSQPLPLGMASEDEVALILLSAAAPHALADDGGAFLSDLNSRLPEGLEVTEALFLDKVPTGKRVTIGSLSWGSQYRVSTDLAPASLLELLAAEASSRGIELSAAVEGDSLLVRLPNAQRREDGITRLVESLMPPGSAPGVLSIAKLGSLARDERGLDSLFTVLAKAL